MAIQTNWNQIFQDLKYSFSAEIKTSDWGWPKFCGKYKNKDLIITPSSGALTFYISLKAGFELGLTNENIFSIALKMFQQDIQIGTEDFDSRYMIKGGPEDRVIEFLSYDRVRGAIRCFEPIRSFYLCLSSLEIIRKIGMNEIFTIEKTDFLIERLQFLADAVENPSVIEEEDDDES